MSEIRFRLAKPSDAKLIANCHWHVRDRYTQGIFLSLGKGFLREYYKVLLNDPWEVVVCGVKEDGKIVGFCSATMDAKKQAENITSHKFVLGLAALKALLIHPSLIKALIQRYKSLKDDNAPQFVTTSGVRSEYVCWMKDEANTIYMAAMERAKSKILLGMGVREIQFEVDSHNEKLVDYHLHTSGAEKIGEATLPDGRIRYLFKRKLK